LLGSVYLSLNKQTEKVHDNKLTDRQTTLQITSEPDLKQIKSQQTGQHSADKNILCLKSENIYLGHTHTHTHTHTDLVIYSKGHNCLVNITKASH